MNTGGPFVRYSMAGWVFLIVLVASVALSPNPAPWMSFTSALTRAAAANQAVGSIAAVAFGIVAGLSAPPALGYVLTRAGRTMIAVVRSLGRLLPAEPGDQHGASGTWRRYRAHRAAFLQQDAQLHMTFYGEASQSLIDWRNERLIESDASISCALAGIAAVIIAQTVFGATALVVSVATVTLAVVLVWDGWSADRTGRRARILWATQRGASSHPRRGVPRPRRG
jgi:hypothetical protein